MADPDVILLDEPAAGVNPTLLEFIIDRLLQLNGRGKSILLIEHNMDAVARLCSRVVVMAARPGRIAHDFSLPFLARYIETGDARAVKSAPDFIAWRERLLQLVHGAGA